MASPGLSDVDRTPLTNVQFPMSVDDVDVVWQRPSSTDSQIQVRVEDRRRTIFVTSSVSPDKWDDDTRMKITRELSGVSDSETGTYNPVGCRRVHSCNSESNARIECANDEPKATSASFRSLSSSPFTSPMPTNPLAPLVHRGSSPVFPGLSQTTGADRKLLTLNSKNEDHLSLPSLERDSPILSSLNKATGKSVGFKSLALSSKQVNPLYTSPYPPPSRSPPTFSNLYKSAYAGFGSTLKQKDPSPPPSPDTRSPASNSPRKLRKTPSPIRKTYVRQQIYFYNREDPYYGFTNFSPHPVEYKGKVYPTSEHLFQSFKFQEHRPLLAEHIRLFSDRPSSALSEARRFQPEVRRDWKDVNVDMMDTALWHKFNQHPDLKQDLLGTGDAELIEDSDKDSFWGVGANRQGRNELGKALERLRAKFRVQKN
ncbi:hypothetical protein M0805_007674 [Coniferiporia weirii]|nr:hypothetical protein M0805_007674 [Coniferiporia weirii]